MYRHRGIFFLLFEEGISMKKRGSLIMSLFVVSSGLVCGMQQKEIISGASFFAIADKDLVTERRTYMSEIKKKSTCHDIYKQLCKKSHIKYALEKENKKAVVFLDRDEKIIYYELTDDSRATLCQQAQQKLDPKVKPLAIRAIIRYHVAIGRALFLYDKGDRCLCFGEYKGPGIRLSESARKIFGQYIDLSALQEIENDETESQYVKFLGERLKRINAPG